MNSFFLTMFIFSPLLGVLALLFVPKEESSTARFVGTAATILPLACSVILYGTYLSGSSFDRFSQKADWIQFGNFTELNGKFFNVPYELGIDGFSFVMMLLTAVLGTLVAIAAFSIKQQVRGFYMLLLILEIGMLGVFAAENLVLFFIFFELTLVPMFFLVGRFGKFASEKAAYSFLIYNGIGSAILLIVFTILFARTGTANMEMLQDLLNDDQAHLFAPISESLRVGLFLALLVAFGIKLPIFPLHRWMVHVHVQAPPPVVMLHAGVLLKIGAYGMIRFGMGLFPEQFEKFAVLLAILGVINLLYGAFLALIQTDFRKVLAYSSISHMGIVLLGLASLNTAGVQGAIFQVVSHGLIAALLFFLLGLIEERFGTSNIERLGALAKKTPILSGFLLAGAMASLGLPSMSGFVSEFFAFLGLFNSMPIIAAVGTLGIILTAAYLLRAVLGMTFGTHKESYRTAADVRGWEFIPIITLIFLIVAIGIMPSILAEPISTTLQTLGIGG
ncbi:NADH-quinone oxidoreductase subunit M [Bacillus sp. 165]|uniref:complex I subunit 4 family protein n=1 Tax=Bacillus sp. 165 TaxID=1529117 RepID=UPI001ADAC2BD|nr:NADH-quinone oxidoreductase subunit M [Bacillus sp. 165]MBO9130048.1 NADH-quinone oxidoreductase subunit M [Bacillus sp. 165]